VSRKVARQNLFAILVLDCDGCHVALLSCPCALQSPGVLQLDQ
jgi:hypothetical protein